ncbi:hypothetical protein GCM10009839_59730 [Catenulispora yoronensis]|uniref:PE domain-containing protein n=1 Tax=Catenulispora yoronensis TaxID=450799 RepID=A0ABP5GI80_9ACTN
MGDNLRADLGRIHDLVHQLSQLRSNLVDAPSRFDESAADMGNKAMSAATTVFGDDWGVFRTQLVDDITKLGVFADTAAKTYAGLDADLARQIHGVLDAPPPSHRMLPTTD